MSDEPLEAGADAPTDSVADADPRTPCQRRADEVCALFDGCEPLLGRWYADKAACVAGERQLCERDLDIPGVIDGVAQVDACSRELAASPRCPGGPVALFCASARPRGTLSDGAPCLHDEQCAGGLCKSILGGLAEELMLFPECGHCAPRAVVGDPCVFGNNDCDNVSTTLRPSGLACDRATSKCAVRPATLEPCASGADCDSKRCLLGIGCAPALVGPPKPGSRKGDWLALGAACREGVCGGGLWCHDTGDPSTARCTAPGAIGDRCPERAACGHVLTCGKSPVDGWMRCLDARPACE